MDEFKRGNWFMINYSNFTGFDLKLYFIHFRYLMYIKGPFQIYFIDRENAVFQIEGLSFVSLRDRNRHLVDTLVDGEMVIDTEAGGQKTPRYLIYDLISLEGSKTLSYNFPTRYRAIKVI